LVERHVCDQDSSKDQDRCPICYSHGMLKVMRMARSRAGGAGCMFVSKTKERCNSHSCPKCGMLRLADKVQDLVNEELDVDPRAMALLEKMKKEIISRMCHGLKTCFPGDEGADERDWCACCSNLVELGEEMGIDFYE